MKQVLLLLLLLLLRLLLLPDSPPTQVTRRLVDVKLVERPEDRNWLIVLLEFCYRCLMASIF